MMLKFFTDRAYLPAGLPHVTLLYPFWGTNPEPQGDPNTGRFDQLAERGRQFLSLTSLKDADVAILPFGWEHGAFSKEGIVLAEQLSQEAQAAGKPMALFFSSDSMKTLPNSRWLAFRTSVFRSRKSPNEFALPAWSEDFVDRYLQGESPVRPKRGKPVVGFCGFAPSRPMMLKRVALGVRDYWKAQSTGADTRGRYLRAAAVQVLEESSRVETNFVLRDRFLGGRCRRPENRIGMYWRRLVKSTWRISVAVTTCSVSEAPETFPTDCTKHSPADEFLCLSIPTVCYHTTRRLPGSSTVCGLIKASLSDCLKRLHNFMML